MDSLFSIYLFYVMFYFIVVYFSNFKGGNNRGSMDPVHNKGSVFCTFPFCCVITGYPYMIQAVCLFMFEV